MAKLKEYTGTGASGGNATDGNDIPSPRPFKDDEAEIDNYLEKNFYGGEGNHFNKDIAQPNPNRTKVTIFEKIKITVIWQLDLIFDKYKLYSLRFVDIFTFIVVFLPKKQSSYFIL